MCLACHMVCCASDEFEGCGCVHCDDPSCWPPERGDLFDEDERDLDDEDDGGMLMPLAACGCAPAPGFRCEAVQA